MNRLAPRAEDRGACCEHRPLQLDRLYEERCAGMDDAAAAIVGALRAEFETTQDAGLLRAVEIALRHREKRAESHAGG